MSRGRRRKKIVLVDEVKEITDAEGRRHLIKKILSVDAEGNIIAEDSLGRIVSIRVKKPAQPPQPHAETPQRVFVVPA